MKMSRQINLIYYINNFLIVLFFLSIFLSIFIHPLIAPYTCIYIALILAPIRIYTNVRKNNWLSELDAQLKTHLITKYTYRKLRRRLNQI